jgi:hypothetical protein
MFKTVQAQTKQEYVYNRFWDASVGVIKLSARRANLQGLLYGWVLCVEELQFGVAYLCGLLLIRIGPRTFRIKSRKRF